MQVRGQKHSYEGTKAFLKGRKPGLFVNFCQLTCSWIRIRIPNTYPDPNPRQPNECGSRKIRIHNTAYNPCPSQRAQVPLNNKYDTLQIGGVLTLCHGLGQLLLRHVQVCHIRGVMLAVVQLHTVHRNKNIHKAVRVRQISIYYGRNYTTDPDSAFLSMRIRIHIRIQIQGN